MQYPNVLVIGAIGNRKEEKQRNNRIVVESVKLKFLKLIKN